MAHSLRIGRDEVIDRKQVIQMFGKKAEETMETKLAVKKNIFLLNVAKALKQMSSALTVESTTTDNTLLKDLVQLENHASSVSVSLFGDLDLNGNQSSGGDYIVLENPMTFAHNLN